MSENKNQQYVILPKKEEENKHLKKYEILIYVCIRRYMNKNMEAFPALDTIVKDSGCSKPTVIKMIETIENKGYFKRIPKSKSKSKIKGKGCVYVFNNEQHFEPFSYDFLDNPKLTKSEKLQILCTQQYMVLDESTQQGKVSYSDRELSEKTGLDYRTIKKNHNSLIDKGFANQITLHTKDPVTGLMNKETIYHLDKVGQAIVFAIRNHEERLQKLETLEGRIQKLEDNQELLVENNKSLAKDNELLVRENTKLKKEIELLKQAKEKKILNMEF